jgi:eukaryotic-like serine/threonine-protein kinase
MPGDYRQNYTYGGSLPTTNSQAAYSATDKAGNHVVIKLIYAADAAGFLQQVQAAAGFVHPNVARILDWGMDGQYCYIISERVAGVEVASLGAGHALDPRTVADVGEQAAAGLSALHEHGLVHGGIDSHTLVYTPDGAVKILDLGLRDIRQPVAPGQYPGAAGGYLSPEEAAGYAPSPASDQYALGAVLYELASGRKPQAAAPAAGAGAQTEAQTILMGPPGAAGAPSQTVYGAHGPITPLRAAAPDFPFTLESVIMRALDPDPARRFGSMEQMRREIQRTRQEAPAPAFFETPPEVQHEQPRRVWPWVVLAIVVLAAIGVGAAYALGVFSGSGVTTPNLVDKTLAEAKSSLSDAGLVLGTIEYAPDTSAQTANLIVVAQSPTAGTSIDEGGKVDLTLGAGETTVPNVVDLTQAQASTELQAAGLSIATVQATPSSAVPAGQVTAQTPEAGTKVKSGSQVTLTVSAGTGTPTVPDVTGDSENAATKALNKAGFNVKVEEAASGTVPAGTVINQQPTAGVKANKDSTVTITVSTGPSASPSPTATTTPTTTPTGSPSP